MKKQNQKVGKGYKDRFYSHSTLVTDRDFSVKLGSIFLKEKMR